MMKSSKLIFFRFNCGGMWGLGHLYRNLLLIQKMRSRGIECIAIINDFDVAKKTLSDNHVIYHIVNEYEKAEEVLDVLNYYKFLYKSEVIFFDRLDSNIEYIKQIQCRGCKILCYDDYDPSALMANMIINTRKININGVEISCSGPRYQILRDDVVKFAKKEKHINNNVKNVLIHFGGTDPLNVLSLAFNAIKGIDKIEFTIIVGKGTVSDPIRIEDETLKNIHCYHASSQFSELLYDADIAVLSGGVTMFEAAAIGTPMILINHNEDQNMAAGIFETCTYAINMGIATEITAEEIKTSICSLASDYSKRQEMSKRLKEFVDTDGTERVCQCLEEL